MALKFKLTKADYEKLTKPVQDNYKLNGDEAVLDIEDYEDPTAATNAKNREKEDKKKALARVKELEAELEAITTERDGMLSGSVPKGDVEKLTKNLETKMAKKEKELSDALAARDSQLSTLLVDNVASGIASKISTAPAVMLPHLRARLRIEHKDGKATTVVLDQNGQPSDMTPELLEKEFLANKDFAPIITASRGSGGGANGANRGGGAATAKQVSRAEFDQMDATAKQSFVKEKGTVVEV